MKKGDGNMAEFEYLFCIELQKKLREKIVGNIFVKVNLDDELIVNIRLEYENINYGWKTGDISKKLLHGYNSDDAVWDVYNSYKGFIINHFFKTGRSSNC